jgi:hypothetical protein
MAIVRSFLYRVGYYIRQSNQVVPVALHSKALKIRAVGERRTHVSFPAAVDVFLQGEKVVVSETKEVLKEVLMV